MTNAKFVLKCAECDAEFGAFRPHAKFCATPCRKIYNNRRASRGAELYDFVMGMRIVSDRSSPQVKDCRSTIESLASGYREADKRYRGGRKSWLDYRDALDALGRLPGVEDQR